MLFKATCAYMVKAKAKKGFTAKSNKLPKKATITKMKPAQAPKDAIEALVQQAGASLSLSELEKEKAMAKSKSVKHQAKARRSVVRRQRRQRKAGKAHKQRRKGIN